jgi:hypothetical protein
MNNKLKFLEIMLSDLVSERDSLELELNRILNDDISVIVDKKIEFDKILDQITMSNNKIKTLSEYMGNLLNPEINNNND